MLVTWHQIGSVRFGCVCSIPRQLELKKIKKGLVHECFSKTSFECRTQHQWQALNLRSIEYKWSIFRQILRAPKHYPLLVVFNFHQCNSFTKLISISVLGWTQHHFNEKRKRLYSISDKFHSFSTQPQIRTFTKLFGKYLTKFTTADTHSSQSNQNGCLFQ